MGGLDSIVSVDSFGDMIARRLWTAGDHGCKSCRTIRRLHKFYGYCTRCYPIIYRISRIDRGLYHFRGRWAHPNSSTAGIRKNAETELEQIRILEAPIRDGAIGTDVENLLIAIVEHARAKPEGFECVGYFLTLVSMRNSQHESMAY